MGFVLYFESKPVCLISFWQEDDSTAKFKEGWDVYKKYEKFFPHENYIFDECKRNVSSKLAVHINLINKKGLVECIEKYSNIFKDVLHREALLHKSPLRPPSSLRDYERGIK